MLEKCGDKNQKSHKIISQISSSATCRKISANSTWAFGRNYRFVPARLNLLVCVNYLLLVLLLFVSCLLFNGVSADLESVCSSGSCSHFNQIQVSLTQRFIIFCSDPTLVGREELYAQTAFLCSQFCPIDIFIVESCEWYH